MSVYNGSGERELPLIRKPNKLWWPCLYLARGTSRRIRLGCDDLPMRFRRAR